MRDDDKFSNAMRKIRAATGQSGRQEPRAFDDDDLETLQAVRGAGPVIQPVQNRQGAQLRIQPVQVAVSASEYQRSRRASPNQPVRAVPLPRSPSQIVQNGQAPTQRFPSAVNQNSQALVAQAPAAVSAASTTDLSKLVPELASLARRVSLQSKLSNADHVLKRGLSELMGSRRVHIFYLQPQGTIESIDGLVASPGSIAHQVMTSRKPIIEARASQNAAYNPQVDNPGGDGSEAMFAFPIGAMGMAFAVCVLVRPGHMGRPYGADEARIASFMAAHVAPAIQLLIAQQNSTALERSGGSSMYRQEALDQNQLGISDGEVIRISPIWIKATYRLLIAIAVIGLAYLVIARIDESSIGPAVIRVQGDQLTARVGATVSRVLVHSGEEVREGQLLVELYSAAEATNLTEVESAYRTQMATFLLQPGDVGARAGLASISAQRTTAMTALEEKSIRAPRAGVVRDLRIREGMPVGPGDHLVTIEREGTLPEIIALLPGNDRPQLSEGMEIRLSIPGYQSLPADVKILEIGTEVIGPAEARRFLGPTLADAFPIEGPVVLVKAQLTTNIFEEGNDEYELSDGMALQAEVTLDSQSMISALFGGDL